MIAGDRYTAFTATINGNTYAYIKHLGSIIEWVERLNEYGDIIRNDIGCSFDDSVYWALACAACGTEWEGHYPEFWNDCAPEWLNEMTL